MRTAKNKHNRYAQIWRASVSVPSNSSEGLGRNSIGEFKQFLGIASGSLCEVETHLIIAQKRNFVNENRNLEVVLDKINLFRK